MPRKLTNQEFIAKCIAAHSGKYDYSSTEYLGNGNSITYKCPLHGYVTQRANDHLSKRAGCPECGGVKRMDKDSFSARATRIHADKYTYQNVEYTNVEVKVAITCSTHGDFWQTPHDHLAGHGCAKCAGLHPLSKEDFIIRAVKLHGDKYDYSKVVYTNFSCAVTIICPKHGEFTQIARNHLTGRKCASCASSDQSRPELLLYSELREFTPVSDKSVLNGLELDLYFKEYNLAVEVNGLYRHSDKDIAYHVGKTDACEAKGIQLLHFTDSQILNKLPIVTGMIKSYLVPVKNTFAAEDCALLEVGTEDANTFLNENYILGTIEASIIYGLYTEESLVALMAFSKKEEWEIIRYTTKLDTCIVGGASKLFAHFLKEINPESVMSYADKMYGNGGVYSQLGFTYERDTECGYSYHHSDGRIVGRVAAQKHKLPKLLGDKFDAAKTEVANMKASGFHRLYDCGHKVFVWHKPT